MLSLQRLEEINNIVKKNIGRIVEEDIDWGENILITVNRAETAKNFSYSEVFISVFPEGNDKTALKILDSMNEKIQKNFDRGSELGRMLKIKFKIERFI